MRSSMQPSRTVCTTSSAPGMSCHRGYRNIYVHKTLHSCKQPATTKALPQACDELLMRRVTDRRPIDRQQPTQLCQGSHGANSSANTVWVLGSLLTYPRLTVHSTASATHTTSARTASLLVVAIVKMICAQTDDLCIRKCPVQEWKLCCHLEYARR